MGVTLCDVVHLEIRPGVGTGVEGTQAVQLRVKHGLCVNIEGGECVCRWVGGRRWVDVCMDVCADVCV